MKDTKKGGALSNLVGSRIRLLHTDDPYTSLHYGSRGTITDITYTPGGEAQIWCKWDNGSMLAMIGGKDVFDFVNEDENESE